jgi:hypothetical protein
MEKIVRIFDTFEEADAADAVSRGEMTPQQRVEIFFAIRERAFPDVFDRWGAGCLSARICESLSST